MTWRNLTWDSGAAAQACFTALLGFRLSVGDMYCESAAHLDLTDASQIHYLGTYEAARRCKNTPHVVSISVRVEVVIQLFARSSYY